MKIICENIVKSYTLEKNNTITVLNKVNFNVFPETFASLRGASGAGKSTLLHIIGGMDYADFGSVYFIENDDRIIDITKYNDKQLSLFRNKNIGFVFQFHHLLPEFNALENVMMPQLIAGYKYNIAEKNAIELMDITGISHRLKHKPQELSGGEQQRIAIARALINKPKLLLADEPTGNLDEKNSEIILQLISNLRQEYKITCLIATHSKLVSDMADIEFLMKDGMITNI